MKKKKRSL